MNTESAIKFTSNFFFSLKFVTHIFFFLYFLVFAPSHAHVLFLPPIIFHQYPSYFIFLLYFLTCFPLHPLLITARPSRSFIPPSFIFLPCVVLYSLSTSSNSKPAVLSLSLSLSLLLISFTSLVPGVRSLEVCFYSSCILLRDGMTVGLGVAVYSWSLAVLPRSLSDPIFAFLAFLFLHLPRQERWQSWVVFPPVHSHCLLLPESHCLHFRCSSSSLSLTVLIFLGPGSCLRVSTTFQVVITSPLVEVGELIMFLPLILS